MAHNAFLATRPGNVWSGSSAFLTVEITELALQVYQSINGDLGGTWAPSSVITIGGSGLTVSGESRFTDNKVFDCTGAATWTGSATCAFSATTSCNFSGSATLSFSGTSTLAVTANSTLIVSTAGSVLISSAVSFGSGTHTYTNNDISGTIFRTGKTTYLGSSGRTQVRHSAIADVNTTVGVESDTIFYHQTNGVPHSLMLRATTGIAATVGERIRIIFRRAPSTAGSLVVSCESGGDLIDFGTNSTTADVPANAGGADFEFDGTQWRVASYWGVGTSVSTYNP